MINKDQIRRMLDIADIKTSARLMLLKIMYGNSLSTWRLTTS